MNNLSASAFGTSLIQKLKTSAAKVWAVDKPGERLIEGFEGCRLKAYQDVAGVWTIGWGSTFYANGAPVKKGDMLPNIECANDLFEHTLKSFSDTVNRLVKVPLNQNQFDALVSFQFNTGALGISTLLKKLNACDYAGAALEFLRWDKITDPETKEKRPYAVLTLRRAKEKKLFETPVITA